MFYRRLLFGFCAPICFVAVLVVLGKGLASQAAIENQYRSAARRAMEAQDSKTAKFYYSRLIDGRTKVEPQDRLNWALLLFAMDRQAEGLVILREMAPDKSLGYGPAHRVMARATAAEYRSSPSTETLERWHWHLRSGVQDDSTEAHQLWGTYLLTVGRNKEALDRLALAAERVPNMWLEVALLAVQMGEQERANKYLETSLQHARRRLEKDIHELNAWILLVKTLVAKNDLQEAEKVAAEALAYVSDPLMARTASDLALFTFDQCSPEEVDRKFELLSRASKLDRNNASIYPRFVKLYQQVEDESQREGLRDRLLRTIAEGKDTAFAHFALGSIYFIENDPQQSLFHVEQAFQQVPQMLDVANNLAWLLANGPNKDIPRAEVLIRSVLERQPDSVKFRDTLASVLEARQAWKEALAELETVLPRVQGEEKRDVHRRLSIVYRSLGNERMAEMHHDLAGL